MDNCSAPGRGDGGRAGAGAAGGAEVAPGAVVRGSVSLGRGVRIGRGCMLEGDIRVGDGTRIDDYCIVRGRVTIGERNWIYPFCSIGTGPHHLGHPEDPHADPASVPAAAGAVAVGSDNVVREYTSINGPVSGRTSVGSRCYIFAHSHIHHDCAVGDGVTLATSATLGGHSEVHSHANLGFLVAVHQFCRVGRYAMVGMQNPVVKDVLPFSLINRQRFAKINRAGMERGGFAPAEIDGVEGAYRRLAPRLRGGRVSGGAGAEGGAEAEILRFASASRRAFYSPEV